jgi:hypothetical protein
LIDTIGFLDDSLVAKSKMRQEAGQLMFGSICTAYMGMSELMTNESTLKLVYISLIGAPASVGD